MITAEEIIEEIRASRRRMSELCKHDPDRYIEYLRKFNRKYSNQVERFKKKYRASLVKT
jgi:hypothetical protein